MGIAFQHVHIKTTDVEKTVQYYIDNFGATRKAPMGDRGWQIDLHGTQINITVIMTDQNHEQHLGIEHMAVTTDDYPGTMAKLRANGVEILEELIGGSGARVAFVAATDGSQMEIIEKV